MIRAIAGAVVWSYLTATWTLTARSGVFIAPQGSVLGAAFVGAGLGALGGVLLVAIAGIGRALRGER